MDNPPKKLDFVEICRISLEQLVGSRSLQRDIHYSVQRSTRDRSRVDGTTQYNPYPVLVLVGLRSTSWGYDTFRIQDRTNIYFFDEGWPGVEVPEFLRPEDIIPSGSSTLDPSNYERVRSELRLSNEEMNDAIYACNQEVLEKLGTRDIPFNKPVNRVSERGGIPEQYNSRIQQWQQFGDQIYKPSLVQRARVVLGIH